MTERESPLPVLEIIERKDNNRYEARAFVNGRVYSRVFWRSELSGWPRDYKQIAHEEIRQAVIRSES